MSENNKKLFLLDAFALIYRAYFAFGKNHRYNSKGLNTSACLGFTNTLTEVLKKEKPTHIAVVFDAPVATNRELEYSDYKANREEMPDDIRKALPYIKRIIEAFNIPMLKADGYEADDVIGTLAKKAEQKGFITYMMTPDKDFGQLVSENIFMYKPGRGGNPAEKWGVKEVCEKFEVDRPEQVIDILGLWGDAVDNIPGIPGIGEKTAKKLIKQYHSVEGLISHAEELKGKQKENVINFAEQGLLSKRLATIILDSPVEFNEKELRLEDPDPDKIKEVFSELEFRTLAKRILGEELKVTTSTAISGQMDLFGNVSSALTKEEDDKDSEVVELKTVETVSHSYHLVDSKDKREELIAQLSKQKSFCFDTETTGLDEIIADIVGISISYKQHEAYYIPISSDFKEAKAQISEFKAIFENDKIEKIAQNIKYDTTILKRYGIRIAGPLFDTMLAHYLLQPDMRHNMDLLAETYLNYKTISIESLIGKKGKNQLSMADIPLDKVCEYAAEDADITLQLKELFAPKIKGTHVESLFWNIESPLSNVLSDMELEGINLDVKALSVFSKELAADLDSLHNDIISLATVEFNIDSPKQLGQVLFEVLVVTDKPKKTKTGQYSTSEDVLSKLKNKHEIIPKILEYRSLRKLKSTYVDALPELVNRNTGRIHTSFMQAVAATGRLSSNNPNLQNIPIRSEKGRAIRKAFIPRSKDYLLLAADYSQIELRIVAALSEDEDMKKAFKEGKDIHTATAAKVFGVAPKEVDRDMRSKAKAVNFGILYGQTAFGLSQNLNIPRKEAKEIIDSYFEQYPKIRAYIDEQVGFAKKHKYVETIMGRRRYLKDIDSGNAIVRGHAERNAINAPIQGSAADIIKVAMLDIHKKFEELNLKSKMLLQVHDELVFDVHKEEIDQVSALVKELMESAVKINVPLEVEVGKGENWLEAH